MVVQIQVRRDTTANWTAANPVLKNGEPALDINTLAVKYGDGVTPYLGLPIAGVSTAVLRAQLDTVYAQITGSSHIGIENTNPVNARLYIGSGTGSLTDAPTMGIKVKIDALSGESPAGIESNLNLVSGSGSGTALGVIGRIDVNDTVSTGPTVGVWGDVFARVNSGRNMWGANVYSRVEPSVVYTGTMIGAEIATANFGTTDNGGGALSVIGKSTGAKVAFGLRISSDPTSDGQAGAQPNGIRNHILMRTDQAPSDNYLWIGAAPANAPTGVPLVQIAADGTINAGGTIGNSAPVIQLQRTAQTVPSMQLGTNSGTEIRFGNGTAVTDTSVKRAGAAIVSVGPAIWVGDAVGTGNGFAQLWEQSTDPAVASAKAGRLFVRPISGTPTKSQLCVRFQTGAAIVIASEA